MNSKTFVSIIVLLAVLLAVLPAELPASTRPGLAAEPAPAATSPAPSAYPVADAELLALRLLETRAFARALALAPAGVVAADRSSPDLAACWARAALAVRRERFSLLPSEAVAYERGIELEEGLAANLQVRAGGSHEALRPFAADEVGLRSAWSGRALGRLLDRFSPAWREALDAKDEQSLDELLAAALAETAEEELDCSPSPADRKQALVDARKDLADLNPTMISP